MSTGICVVSFTAVYPSFSWASTGRIHSKLADFLQSHEGRELIEQLLEIPEARKFFLLGVSERHDPEGFKNWSLAQFQDAIAQHFRIEAQHEENKRKHSALLKTLRTLNRILKRKPFAFESTAKHYFKASLLEQVSGKPNSKELLANELMSFEVPDGFQAEGYELVPRKKRKSSFEKRRSRQVREEQSAYDPALSLEMNGIERSFLLPEEYRSPLLHLSAFKSFVGKVARSEVPHSQIPLVSDLMADLGITPLYKPCESALLPEKWASWSLESFQFRGASLRAMEGLFQTGMLAHALQTWGVRQVTLASSSRLSSIEIRRDLVTQKLSPTPAELARWFEQNVE
ncbi:MAG: hypothetical protein AB1540_05815 [Bdellovibrionota bacterium]